MPDITWNMDFNGLFGEPSMASPHAGPPPMLTVAQMFRDAVKERFDVLSPDSGETGVGPALVSVRYTHPTISYGTYLPYAVVLPSEPNEGEYSLAWWKALREAIVLLARYYFIKPTELAGLSFMTGVGQAGHRDPPVTRTYDTSSPSIYRTYLSWASISDEPFPPPGGFTRRLTREIRSLSAAGAAGQIARLSARRSVRVNGTPGLFGTPEDRSYWQSTTTDDPEFGKVVNEVPPVTPTSEIVDATPAGEVPLSGRVFGHNGSAWASAADDAVADVIVEQDVTPIYPGDHFGPAWLNDLRDAINALVWTAHAEAPMYNSNYFESSGHTVSFTFACSPGCFFVRDSHFSRIDDPSPIPLLYAGGDAHLPFADRWKPTTLPNPNNRTRTIEYWHRISDGDHQLNGVFELHSTLGNQSGGTGFTVPADLGRVEIDFGDGENYYVYLPFVIVQKWDVEGGFAYTAAT